MHHDIQSWVTAIQQIVCKSDEVLRFLREMVRQMISWEIMVSHTPVTRKCEQLALCLKRNRIYSPSPPPPPPLPPHAHTALTTLTIKLGRFPIVYHSWKHAIKIRLLRVPASSVLQKPMSFKVAHRVSPMPVFWRA